MKNKNILVTGCAGFIGYHLCLKLIDHKSCNIYGIDNLNSYYDVKLKKVRISKLRKKSKDFTFNKVDISEKNKLLRYSKNKKFDYIINLAAQAGVRFSIENPQEYVSSNIVGFFNILELSRIKKIAHLLFASTSSVYGDSKKFPLKEIQNTDRPISFYAASKKSNEVLAYSYSSIHKVPITGLRFFTVYGPYGRPDMALAKFTKAIKEEKPITLFNGGKHERDFTHVDDVVDSIIKLIKKPSKEKIPYDIFNIASSNPKKLTLFIKLIEKNLSKKASKKILLPLQKGDVFKTHANTDKLKKKINYKSKISLEDGIQEYINWYNYFYK